MNMQSSDTSTDYHAAPRTRIPAFTGGFMADSMSQEGILPLQTMVIGK